MFIKNDAVCYFISSTNLECVLANSLPEDGPQPFYIFMYSSSMSSSVYYIYYGEIGSSLFLLPNIFIILIVKIIIILQ